VLAHIFKSSLTDWMYSMAMKALPASAGEPALWPVGSSPMS
jgi:hypothetical protein